MRSEQRIGCMTGDERDWHASALGSTKKMFKIMKWGNKDIGSVQYYIFDRWIPPERSSYGIQISDAAGGLIFDSGWMFMKIRNVIWMDPGYPNHTGDDPEVGTNWTVVGSAGAGNLAMAMPNPGVDTTELEWRRLDDVRVLSLFGRRQQDNSFIGSSRGYLWTPPDGGWANPNTRSQIMVIDVDGLPTNYFDANIIPGFTS